MYGYIHITKKQTHTKQQEDRLDIATLPGGVHFFGVYDGHDGPKAAEV
jgi:hypothetical protein